MTHTPGPWTAGEKKYLPQEIRGGGHRIAQAMYWSGSENAGEVEANARLIAAAPEMFEVCQFALEKLNRMTTDEFSKGGDKEIREKLDRVLAQAGGGLK